MKVEKTHLGEGLVVCDTCMQMAKRSEVIEIRSPLSTIVLHQHKVECRK
jgi:hypothetical protein